MRWLLVYVAPTLEQTPGTGKLREIDELSTYACVVNADTRENAIVEWQQGHRGSVQRLGEFDGVLDITPSENILSIDEYE